MTEAQTERLHDGQQAYYTTSYTFTGTTSSVPLLIWRTLSDHLVKFQKPMTAAELSQAIGVPAEEVEKICNQSYYQRYYGFRRFASLEEWERWAKETGVLYNPELHDPKPEPAAGAADGEAVETTAAAE
jgi:hypothetical protein